MLRFIIQRIEVDANIGMRSEDYKTVDIDIPELEKILVAGGRGPAGFEMFRLAGVEILEPDSRA